MHGSIRKRRPPRRRPWTKAAIPAYRDYSGPNSHPISRLQSIRRPCEFAVLSKSGPSRMVRCLLRSDVFWVSPLDAEREAPGRGAVDLQVLNFGASEEVLDRVFRPPVVHVR